MIANHPRFIEAIHERKNVSVRYYSTPDADVVDRVCAPLDYGPGMENPEGVNRYWLWDYEAGADGKFLGLAPQQILELQLLGSDIDATRLDVPPSVWTIPREWNCPSNGSHATSNVPIS